MAAERSTHRQQAEDISAAITSIHSVSYDRDLSSVDTVVWEGCVASVLRFEVEPAERLVIQAGAGDAVMRLYDATELSLEPALCAAVERTTGRTVVGFQTAMNPHHGLIVEAFVLGPSRPSGELS
jgi:uncharacterized protein YbcI